MATYPCRHLAALLFNVFSGPGTTPLSEGYSTNLWSHLVLGLCRSHADTTGFQIRHQANLSQVVNAKGIIIFSVGIKPGHAKVWRGETLLPAGWESLVPAQSQKASKFVNWAHREILEAEKANLKALGNTPSLRAEFGLFGDLGRQAFLVAKKINARLDWNSTDVNFSLHFEDLESGLEGFACLEVEQGYTLHKRVPSIRLGEGFDEGTEIENLVETDSETRRETILVEEPWQKGLEIRVVSGNRLRIRPYAQLGENKVFLQTEKGELRFGDRILIENIGFRKVSSGDSPLLKKYLGWKTYFVDPAELPGFMQKFGISLVESPLLDLDPFLVGNFHAAQMEEIVLKIHGKVETYFQIGIEYHTSKEPASLALDLGWLKSQWESDIATYLTTDGWIDFTGFEWSWLKPIKPEHWLPVENKPSLLLDLPQLFRLCALHHPQTIRVQSKTVFPELEFISTLAKDHDSQTAPQGTIPSEGLRPYQQEGLQWLSNLVTYGLSGLLADDMGLGKTHQVMSLIQWNHIRSNLQSKTLIVCPTSVLYHWKTKLDKFHPDIKSVVYHGSDRDKKLLKQPICITSYGIVRNDIDLLSESGYDLLILDEIQFLKNRDSETHKALRDFPSRSIIGMTGTPLENSPSDVKNIFDLILPGYFPGEAEFRHSILDPLESALTAGRARDNFLGLCRPFILRRTKAEVLTDLPEKVEETSFCDLAEGQEALYQECLLERGGPLLGELQGKQASSLLHVFQLLNHLKQICNHPLTLPGIKGTDLEYQSGKWDLFVYLLESALEAGHKIVVFSQYLAMLARIEDYLKQKNIGFTSLTGSTTNRDSVLKRFESEAACRVFCCSLKAGGVGIDLTAASTVIHYDRWWNAAKENQATDRVHRIGQNRNVQVYKLVTRKTIEEKIDAIIRKKAMWMDSLLPNDGEGGIKLFTRDELMELLTPSMSS